MSEEKGIRIEIKEGMLYCEIPLNTQPDNATGSKMATYGALKIAEEQASIFYMKKAMQQQSILAARAPMIKPVVH